MNLLFRRREGDFIAILAVYYARKKVYYDLITIYSDKVGITTSNTKDALMLPQPPGKFIQAFHGMYLDGMLEKHREAGTHLETTMRLHSREIFEDSMTLMKQSVRAQMTYVRSLPLLYLRGSYWYSLRLNLLSKK